MAELVGEEAGKIVFLPMMIFLTAILIIFFAHRLEFDVQEKLERGTDATLEGRDIPGPFKGLILQLHNSQVACKLWGWPRPSWSGHPYI